MSYADIEFESIHPIDIAENLIAHNCWDYDRINDDQVALAVEGQWHTYSITLAWSPYDDTLRQVCTFECKPPKEKRSQVCELLNLINDKCWGGAFTYWEEQDMIVFRYGLILSGENTQATPEQIDTMIGTAVLSAERYYPAFQLVIWGDTSPAEAMNVAICEAYGTA